MKHGIVFGWMVFALLSGQTVFAQHITPAQRGVSQRTAEPAPVVTPEQARSIETERVPRSRPTPAPAEAQRAPTRTAVPPPATTPARPLSQIYPYDEFGRPNPDAFDWSGISLGPTLGTMGLGLETTAYLFENINFRFGLTYLDFKYKDTLSGIDYTFDWSTLAGAFLFDFYPGMRQNFRFTAGLVVKDWSVDVSGRPRGDVSIGRQPFTEEEVGRIRGRARYDTVSPYLGIGFGNTVSPDALLTVFIDLGVIIQGYSLKLDSDGTIDQDVKDQALRSLRSDVKDRLDWLKIYPVCTVGIAYHF